MEGQKQAECCQILVVVGSLSCGGTERVVSILASLWVKTGNKVAIAVLSEPSQSFFAIDDRVEIYFLGQIDWEGSNRRRISRAVRTIKGIQSLRRLIAKIDPCVVVSFGNWVNCLTILSCFGTRRTVLVSVRHDPRRLKFRSILVASEHILYFFARRIIIPSRYLSDAFPDYFQKKLLVLPNPIVTEGIPSCTLENKMILNVGRMSSEKGHRSLLRAIQVVKEELPKVKLRLIGSGNLLPDLKADIAIWGLSSDVEICNQRSVSPSDYLDACVYALPSETEGWPNAVAEAMSFGLPLVAFDSQGGIRDLVYDGQNGYLVPLGDSAKFAQKLVHILRNRDLALQMGRESKRIVAEFEAAKVANCWIEAMQCTVKVNGR